jgi:methylenetetrahydrofolate reductase (NADPH)
MRIIDLIHSGGPTISFEFFPPKDDAGFADLFQTIEALKPLRPSCVSVTYGAGGGTRRKTVDLVQRIKHEIGIESMAHLTCVGSTREDLASVLDDLAAGRMENVLALRGDPPKGENEFVRTVGGFGYANELVEFIRSRYAFCVGGACYPEKHPEAPDADKDLDNLKRKVDAGAEFLITQLFFDNQDFYRFRDRAVARGIALPILAGIMPILSVKQIKRFTQMCGATIPPGLLANMEALEDDADAVRQLGMYHATRQCEDLLQNGVHGLHFYTLNRSTATRAICRQIHGMLPAAVSESSLANAE